MRDKELRPRLLLGFVGLGSALTHAPWMSPLADYGGTATCSLVQYVNGGSTPVSVKIEASCYVDTSNNNLESDCTGTVGYVVRGFKTSIVKNNKADYVYMGAPGRCAASRAQSAARPTPHGLLMSCRLRAARLTRRTARARPAPHGSRPAGLGARAAGRTGPA